jgi:L-fuconolactonase
MKRPSGWTSLRRSAGLVRGVVGWKNLVRRRNQPASPSIAADRLLEGLRLMLQDIDDTAWILFPPCSRGSPPLVRHGLRFDALIKPRHLPVIGGNRPAPP